MLVSCKLTGNPKALAAYHAKEENYYYAQGQTEGEGGAHNHVRVNGELAARLGFTPGQAITEAQLEDLLAGKSPKFGLLENKRQRGAERTVIGIDLTFSAPKSVSVAGLVTDKNPAILAAHDRAVLETMREIESYCAAARPVVNGKQTSVKTGNMAYVTVRDGFNRNHEPHIHTHVVVMNMTQCGDKIMALDGRQIMRQDFNKLWGSLYRANLAAHLKEVGYSVSYTKKGELRLDSVSLELERAFSTRAEEIKAAVQKAKENGKELRDMDAWRNTREEKDPSYSAEKAREDWRTVAARFTEKSVEQNRAEASQERKKWLKEAVFSREAQQELKGERGDTEAARWQAAARRATEQNAAATAGALITEYITEAMRGEKWEPLTYAEAEARLRDEVNAGRILATDDGRFTTWEMTRADRECLRERQAAAPLALRADSAAFHVAEYIKTAKALNFQILSEQQAAVAGGILAAAQGTVVVQGDAGAGKTTMLRAVNSIAGLNGWDVVGLAVQGVAARKLQEESGITSTTLSSYNAVERFAAGEERTHNSGGRGPRLVVVDEASMVGSRDMAELLRLAAKHGDKVVLVGDQNQIQAIGAGRPFDRLVGESEKAGNLLNLTENYRQKDAVLREAVGLARDGHMRESLDVLAKSERIIEIRDTSLRRLRVACEYSKDTLILAGSRDSRDEMNRLIRDNLARKGDVDRTTAYTYSLAIADSDGVKRPVRRELAVGDVVTFLENEYKKYDVRNGERGTVTMTGEDALSVRLEDGREVALELRHYSALDYGYALTTYKSQGQTYDRVYVEADTSSAHLQDQRNTYVQITRARNDVRILTDDKAELREIAGVLNYKSDTLELQTSFERAAAMERKIHTEAFGERATQEAAAKIAMAEAQAAADARGLEAMTLGKDDVSQGASEESSREVHSTPLEPSQSQPPSPRETDPSSQGRRGASSRLLPGQVPLSPSVTAHPVFVKAFEDARPTLEELAAKGAANVAEPDFIMDIYRENHTKIHELVDEVKKHAKELTKDRRIEISRELDEVSKTELKLMRLANIISEPEAWLEYYEKRDANLTANAPAVPRLALASERFLNGEASLVVVNEAYIRLVGDSKTFLDTYEGHLAEITYRLRVHDGLDDDQKQRIAKELSRARSLEAVRDSLDSPERAVAFGAVRAGVAELDSAAKDLSNDDKEWTRRNILDARHVEELSIGLRVCKSAAGYYIGQLSEDGGPLARFSVEYWGSQEQAEDALACGRWKFRDELDRTPTMRAAQEREKLAGLTPIETAEGFCLAHSKEDSSRISAEVWPSREEAEEALHVGMWHFKEGLGPVEPKQKGRERGGGLSMEL
ncbi:MAG: hypothetical protein A2V88_09195 [Elusimicrobia bacterium RBG_16_66_12]|nr:MAG: hypothetical protein A2V88_09195 [Elusimicrobia bacterium RBG_16_66_12]